MKINLSILAFLLTFTISFDVYACHEEDYIALRALYLSTDGDNWDDNTGWLTAAQFEANPTIPSSISVGAWYGVTTNSDGCVICINMSGGSSNSCDQSSVTNGNNLVGIIPPEIGHLIHLTYLNIGVNKLTSIPAEIGNLNNLIEMKLYANQFSDIPPEIGNIVNLEWLTLSYNQITMIPPEIENLTNLRWLSFGYNQISTIPPELGNLANLTTLILQNNNINGSIPPAIGNLTNLERLDLYGNALNSSIPPELENLNNLESLYLTNNQLSGSIPAQLGNLTNLTHLSLGNNQLSGSIPPEFGNLINLEVLYLLNNQLSGCYDNAIIPFCTQLVSFLNSNATISDGNNFDATWEDFCATGAGTCTVNVDNTHQSTFTIYPIPAKDVVIFDVPNIAAADDIILYDITGREISRQTFPQDKQLAVSHLNDGVYIYRIFYEEKVYSGKIVVE